jgi:hypothetical protein
MYMYCGHLGYTHSVGLSVGTNILQKHNAYMLKMKVIRSPKTSVTTYKITQTIIHKTTIHILTAVFCTAVN